jgi:hypothetical protein
MPKTRGKAVTAAEAAAVNFKPLSAKKLRRLTPPTNEVWIAHLVNIRLAWITLGKTKTELREMVRKDEKAMCDLIEGLRMSASFLRAGADILTAGETRTLCAGSALELEGKGAPAGGRS